MPFPFSGCCVCRAALGCGANQLADDADCREFTQSSGLFFFFFLLSSVCVRLRFRHVEVIQVVSDCWDRSDKPQKSDQIELGGCYRAGDAGKTPRSRGKTQELDLSSNRFLSCETVTDIGHVYVIYDDTIVQGWTQPVNRGGSHIKFLVSCQLTSSVRWLMIVSWLPLVFASAGGGCKVTLLHLGYLCDSFAGVFFSVSNCLLHL